MILYCDQHCVKIITYSLTLQSHYLFPEDTDGGRLSLALFGRSVSRVVRTGTIGIIVFCSFFGGDSVNLLLFYTIYAQLWQRECEIPCKNEIENVDNVRAGVALATGLLVALTVIPMM
jgi:hypothetical protein